MSHRRLKEQRGGREESRWDSWVVCDMGMLESSVLPTVPEAVKQGVGASYNTVPWVASNPVAVSAILQYQRTPVISFSSIGEKVNVRAPTPGR